MSTIEFLVHTKHKDNQTDGRICPYFLMSDFVYLKVSLFIKNWLFKGWVTLFHPLDKG